jgi:hypothetical protein
VAPPTPNAKFYEKDPWTFTDVTGNYNNTSGTVDDNIDKVNDGEVIEIKNGYLSVPGSMRLNVGREGTLEKQLRKAVEEAIIEEARKNPQIFVMGEDASSLTLRRFSSEFQKRVLNTPISENSFVGVGLGAALTGMHPIVLLMFVDLAPMAMDQIANQIAKADIMSIYQVMVKWQQNCLINI